MKNKNGKTMMDGIRKHVRISEAQRNHPTMAHIAEQDAFFCSTSYHCDVGGVHGTYVFLFSFNNLCLKNANINRNEAELARQGN